MARVAAVLALAAAMLALGGCGRGSDARAVRDLSQAFYRAVAARDGARACALLGDETRRGLERQERERCPRAVLGLRLHGSRPAAAVVYLNAARVKLAGGDTVFLEERRDGWRITAAGCRPAGDEEPYDCEVDS